MKKILLNLSAYLYMPLILTGIGLHLWTICIAREIYGTIGAILAFSLPVASEMWLVFLNTCNEGTFFLRYNSIILAYIISYFIIMILLDITTDD